MFACSRARPDRGSVAGRAILTRSVVHVGHHQGPGVRIHARHPFRRASEALVAVPMLREGSPIGAIAVAPRGGRSLQRSADRPPSDLRQPGGHRHRERAPLYGTPGEEPGAHGSTRAGDRVARAADRHRPRSCGSSRARRPISSRSWRPSPRTPPGCAGRRIRRSSVSKGSICVWWPGMDRCPRPLAIGDTLPVSRGYVGGRAVGDRRTIHVEDILAAEAEFPEAVSSLRQARSLNRTMVATPLLREGTPLGVIVVTRGPEPIPSRPSRSRSSRRSPTRPSSPSRTSGCSRSCRERSRGPRR